MWMLQGMFLMYPIDEDSAIQNALPSVGTSAEQLVANADPGVTKKRKPAKTPRRSCRCSKCGQTGHNRRTCINQAEELGPHVCYCSGNIYKDYIFSLYNRLYNKLGLIALF